MLKLFQIGFAGAISLTSLMGTTAIAQEAQPEATDNIDLPPEIIEDSRVLQRWLKKVPNVMEDIRHDPSFSTRFSFGYTWFPSTDDSGGINIALKDIFYLSHWFNPEC